MKLKFSECFLVLTKFLSKIILNFKYIILFIVILLIIVAFNLSFLNESLMSIHVNTSRSDKQKNKAAKDED